MDVHVSCVGDMIKCDVWPLAIHIIDFSLYFGSWILSANLCWWWGIVLLREASRGFKLLPRVWFCNPSSVIIIVVYSVIHSSYPIQSMKVTFDWSVPKSRIPNLWCSVTLWRHLITQHSLIQSASISVLLSCFCTCFFLGKKYNLIWFLLHFWKRRVMAGSVFIGDFVFVKGT